MICGWGAQEAGAGIASRFGASAVFLAATGGMLRAKPLERLGGREMHAPPGTVFGDSMRLCELEGCAFQAWSPGFSRTHVKKIHRAEGSHDSPFFVHRSA